MACTPPVTIKPVTIEWVRVDVGLPTHPKAVLLSTILGNPLAWAYVVACWAYAANHARDGRITARMQPVMERLAGWPGEPGGLVRALVDSGFADQDGSDIALHKWEERQGKAITQTVRDTERRRVARAAAQAQRQREAE
ncbi:hypothetical protein, partial [Corallococcus sp. 4LFB]|uniref:hypothetical protein n=1 Tax=Corallococcus sp. 4LFB TaxID=3383249 RepID=UPI003974D890